jgi:hypothetical protein
VLPRCGVRHLFCRCSTVLELLQALLDASQASILGSSSSSGRADIGRALLGGCGGRRGAATTGC